ncbi:hsp90 co-chaperone Cdc37-like [Watersipora subatra]|uniref:hsp90 co-chaperone Cdc37-like n=1 Tax=Watersipora subatra TaxID=2589382 RepID=UPI00355B1C7F
MPIDYSKWNHIEISDDEDDQHPNIDTASLNKWRHEARLQRMAEAKSEKEQLAKAHTENQQRLTAVREKLKDVDISKDALASQTLSELEKQEEAFKKKEEELLKKEKLTPWNVDTICHEGKSKTIINKAKPVESKPMTDEEKMTKQQDFTKQNKEKLKKFGMLRKYEDSERYLSDNPELACEETANFLVLWCIDLAVEEKEDLMAHVSHQTIVMQFILELAKNLKVDPRACVKAFFTRIRQAEKQYLTAFNDELSSFKLRVKERAEIRLENARKELEEEERNARLGPGGLDPIEVMESLPKEMQECFEAKDIGLLQKVVSEMDPKEAEYHIKRCVDSGMWVPGGGVDDDDEEGKVEEAAGGAEAEEGEDPYATLTD